MNKKTVAIGYSFFDTIIKNNYYYVDKTKMIKELKDTGASVTLFTRPRRFGKTLTLNMLKCFYEIGQDKSLFDGLDISNDVDFCEKYQNKYPVIFISLKDVEGLDYDTAKKRYEAVLAEECRRFHYLLESEKLSNEDVEKLQKIYKNELYNENTIRILCELLYKHHNQKVILLIDEYDVPLQKANVNGYYRDMLSLIRSMFSQSLKDNPYIEFAVLTGCLRVSKESLFTGLNNLNVWTIKDSTFADAFGFTTDDVKEMLNYYNLDDKFDVIKDWYDGYNIGKFQIFNPWSVLNYIQRLNSNIDELPQSFWGNSSGNEDIKLIAKKASNEEKIEIEKLIQGEIIEKNLALDLTYDEIYKSIDSIWSLFFMTGYLTCVGETDDGKLRLRIPNKEIIKIYKDKIKEWFKEDFLLYNDDYEKLLEAFRYEDIENINNILNRFLSESISFYDGGNNEAQKEAFYQAILLTIFRLNRKVYVKSNVEAGKGRLDIAVFSIEYNNKYAFILELKVASKNESLESKAFEALKQITDMNYDDYFDVDTKKYVKHYGIAFRGKECYVVKD